MCELFGINATKEYDITNYLREFFGHSNVHCHGWGTAFFKEDGVQIEKETIQASKSEKVKRLLKDSVKTDKMLGHIRYATIGNVDPENCHPYSGKSAYGRTFTLIHNGTIWDYPPLEKYIHYQKGETDSERIFLYLLDYINDKEERLGRELTDRERFQLFDTLIVPMAKGNKLNLLIFDGEILYVHYNITGFLHYLTLDAGTIFSTLPLSNEDWKSVPLMQLLAYKDGKLLYEGTKHSYEYIESEENIRFLYQIFSYL